MKMYDPEWDESISRFFLSTIPMSIYKIAAFVFTLFNVVFAFDRLFNILILTFNRASKPRKPEDVFDRSRCIDNYPIVAIQLPMMNEIGCCKGAIDAACKMDWPKHRLIVQVLDDSTNEDMKQLIDQFVENHRRQGTQIILLRRANREGFKAGSLEEGMKKIPEAEYVAIFDVDFRPNPDFLMRTLPILIDDPNVAFVQGRWTFLNSKQSFLTRMQHILLNYHHKCEQNARYMASLFFAFNGTGAVWRTKTINEVGGWHTDTLVEDLDLAVRAYVNGWRFVYLSDVECPNELPAALSSYYSQQHRWSSGPMQVFRKLHVAIRSSPHLSFTDKLLCTFFVCRGLFQCFTLVNIVLIVPLTIFVTEIRLFTYFNLFTSTFTACAYLFFSWEDIWYTWFLLIFHNVMCIHHAVAIFYGITDHPSTKKWIVTPKIGDSQTRQSQQSFHSEHFSTKDRSDHGRNLSFKERIQMIIKLLRSTYLMGSFQHDLVPFIWLIYRKISQTIFDKRAFVLGIYLLICSYYGISKSPIFTLAYVLPTTIMSFIFSLELTG